MTPKLNVMVRRSSGDQPVQIMLRRNGEDRKLQLYFQYKGAPQPPQPPIVVDNPAWEFTDSTPFYVAHRLGGRDFPEHTLAGLQASIAAGYRAVEFSTYRCATGEFIGSHDWTTERTTGTRLEIWQSTWEQLSSLQQAAGPLIRLEDLADNIPDYAAICLDHKATSAADTGNQADLESEAALFDHLDELFPDPTKRIVWKTFVGAASAERARARGYRTMCMLYRNEVASADLSRWDILGMEYNAPQDVWDELSATGKPTIAHIIDSMSQASTGIVKGAKGLMSSVPNSVHP